MSCVIWSQTRAAGWYWWYRLPHQTLLLCLSDRGAVVVDEERMSFVSLPGESASLEMW